MQNENFLTTEQVAELLNLSSRTLEGMRCKGNGPAFCKLGRKCLYRQSDINKWVEANLCISTSEVAIRNQPNETPTKRKLEENREGRQKRRKLKVASNDSG